MSTIVMVFIKQIAINDIHVKIQIIKKLTKENIAYA